MTSNLGKTEALAALTARMWRGSYPALVAQPKMDRALFYASYVPTYLQRDVRDLANVGNQTAFLRFMRAAAARTAQLLNIAELARDAEVAPNTGRHWLAILEASGLGHRAPVAAVARQLRQAPGQDTQAVFPRPALVGAAHGLLFWLLALWRNATLHDKVTTKNVA